ncbi:sulfatase-like hydrolase/transferase [Candidimonas nitroreducens]|uniref:Sulfatase n=1 Tax=Candidimonas nitroreducens TaxID=683354 RepID=A0A225MG10_9BURK|nr:sulfatase-like hydrolase/transferase [Candidimonas nitroreducens]OWT59173.1 sulfatase [Candidimonas nitroreducens]
MENRRILILMADEHSTKMLGCQGNPNIHTPNLDRLASQGTLFSAAYCNSPICVPARAAFATGRYVHETACWDNAFGYDGRMPSWGHLLSARGLSSYSIGKLHYKNERDDTGFTEQILPMHLVNGVGDVLGCVRDPLPVRHKSRALATDIGPGESDYNAYDRSIAAAACDWIGKHADESWVLFVSFVAPHFPLICPPEFYRLYDPAKVALPKLHKPEEWPRHPWVAALRDCFRFDDYFKDDDQRCIAIASYMGLCTFVDHQIGQVLGALDEAGIGGETLVIYTSDHGDNVGSRGLWGKSVMYEESVAVPLIIRAPERTGGDTVATPVSHLDIAPTLTDWLGMTPDPQWRGKSLLRIANAPKDDSRVILSEYHAAGSRSAAFMIRQGTWKLVWYADAPSQLFDLATDPEELMDLADDAGCAAIRKALTDTLFDICDPVATDRRAKEDQQALVDQHGGAEAVVARGGFGATPAPGRAAVFAGRP